MSPGTATTQIRSISPRLWARIAGVFYVLIFIAAPAGAATATPLKMLITLVCDAAVALIFYYLFAPVSRRLSFLGATFRLIYVAWMIAVSLNYFHGLPFLESGHSVAGFNSGYRIGLAIFGFHCLLIGYLILRSNFLPRFLGVLMLIAGLCWLIFFFPWLADFVSPYNLVAGGIGEGLLTLWLLAMGVNAEEWKQQAVPVAA
jgi:hypothetical protein